MPYIGDDGRWIVAKPASTNLGPSSGNTGNRYGTSGSTTSSTGSGTVPGGTTSGGNAYQQWLAQMGYTLPSIPSATGQPNVGYPAYQGQESMGLPNTWAEMQNLTPEQLNQFEALQQSWGLPMAELTQNAQQYASDLANTQYQFGQQFPWQQYTDQSAIDLANQRQAWQEQWLPQEQQTNIDWWREQQGSDIANQQALQNQMVDWYGRQQANDIANQQRLQNQMVGWYGTQQANDLAWQREAQAAQLKSDASTAALGAWGRMNRPNARYL